MTSASTAAAMLFDPETSETHAGRESGLRRADGRAAELSTVGATTLAQYLRERRRGGGKQQAHDPQMNG